jgi:thioredoxin-related protein
MKINLKVTLICFCVMLISFRSASMGLSLIVPYYHFHFQPESETSIKWMTMEEAVAQIAEDKSWAKKLFIYVYTDWCGWCARMNKWTFTDPKVVHLINTHFYPVKFNAEHQDDINLFGSVFKFIKNEPRGHHELASALLDGQLSYPCIVYMNEKIEILSRSPGYKEAPQLLKECHYFKGEHYLRTTWKDFEKEYKAP